MAQQVITCLVDDLDGGEAEQTVPFAIDGVSYEIDLSSGNAKMLRDLLAPFVENARRVDAGQARRRRSRTTSSRARSADIRTWAKTQGIKLNERGRIPTNVVDEYEKTRYQY